MTLLSHRWYKLRRRRARRRRSWEIQVTIQFTRNNLSASMFDLSVKDKRRSPFSKIKDKDEGQEEVDSGVCLSYPPQQRLE